MDKRKSNAIGMAIPAGCLIGLGVGMLYNQIAAGTMVGLGCGFLAAWITMLVKK